ncbi:hypothetical protein M5D96_007153 [Drosophila gunungcola]|uniref:Uncharacterized protein n=1 Tax=Drosophila gunungcola TaxID=103775 RepID=A0A9P9YMN2_9MUSC|nr:hypothetical protein M5D96_007153 [Drosophila gunungcola]
MRVPFFGLSPLLANGFYIYHGFCILCFFFLATKLGPGQREPVNTAQRLCPFPANGFDFFLFPHIAELGFRNFYTG